MNSRKQELVRDSDAGDSLELLIVAAIATILINRAFLSLTHYPRIAFGSFHIAHMLWGGLIMLVSIVMLLRYWNPSLRRFAAFTSGIGFGLFIDELGKFITKDNDYFFQPTIAIIYIIFVVMYLLFRRFRSQAESISDREMSVNTLIRSRLAVSEESPVLRGYDYIQAKVHVWFDRMLAIPRFVPSVMILFVLKSLAQFGILLGWVDPDWLPLRSLSGLSLAGAVLSGSVVIVGLFRLRSSRRSAVHWFKRAILLNIFVTQVFIFYQSQLTAIWGLGIDLLVYVCIDYYIRLHGDMASD